MRDFVYLNDQNDVEFKQKQLLYGEHIGQDASRCYL